MKKRAIICCLLSCFLFLSVSPRAMAEGIKESLSDLNRVITPARESNLPWGKNPFLPPSEDRIRMGAKSTNLKGLRLSAIIYNKKNPSAIINQRIVYVGDTIEDQKVVDIKESYVILQSNDKSYRLELKSIIEEPGAIKWGP
ncbi:MAG: hypothetical protein ACE5IH_02335 [Thermodesulfobacteriota bacterium]